MRKFLLLLPICYFSIFAFGQDSIFTYKKDAFKITERYSFYPNGNLKEIHYSTYGERLVTAYSREDLFQRGIKYDSNDSTLMNGTFQDSIVYFRNDERIDSKQYFIKKNRQD